MKKFRQIIFYVHLLMACLILLITNNSRSHWKIVTLLQTYTLLCCDLEDGDWQLSTKPNEPIYISIKIYYNFTYYLVWIDYASTLWVVLNSIGFIQLQDFVMLLDKMLYVFFLWPSCYTSSKMYKLLCQLFSKFDQMKILLNLQVNTSVTY